MRGALRSEAFVVIALAVVVTLLGSAISDPRLKETDLRASSYLDDPSGMLGLYRVLDGLDIPVNRLETRLPADFDPGATLLIVAPSDTITPSEVGGILDWVASGGRLVLVAAPPLPPLQTRYWEDLLDPLGVSLVPGQAEDAVVSATWDLSPAPPVMLWPARRALEQDLEEAPELDPRAGELDPLVFSGAAKLAGRVPFGAGTIVVTSDELVVDNEWLGDADNAYFTISLLLGPGDDVRPVYFDEYHHGFRAEGGKSRLLPTLAGAVADSWIGRALLVLLVGAGVYVAGAAVRFGAPLPDSARSRRSLSEHADALGQLLETARARTEALHVAAAGARRAVGPRCGLSPGIPPEEFDRRLGGLGAPGAEELADVLQRAQNSSAPSEGEFLALAAELARSKDHYLHGTL